MHLLIPILAAAVALVVAKEKTLKEHWINYNESYRFVHYEDYADHYQAVMPYPTAGGPQVKILEIGVQSGGSIRAWKSWYEDQLYLVGVDIEPRCLRSHSPAENIFVEIGSQLNETFLMEVCNKHGPFDFIIDDGGHTAHMVKTSLKTMFPSPKCMKFPSWYIIEDTHVLNMCGNGYCKSSEDFTIIPKMSFYDLHAPIDRGVVVPKPHHLFYGAITEVRLFDSMIFLKHDTQKGITPLKKGTDGFDNQERRNNPPNTYNKQPANWQEI